MQDVYKTDNKPDNKPVILIVDDTPTNIQILAEALKDKYRVKVAGSGPAALDIIAKQGVPDLILLDVMMPGMDGYEVCRILKQDPVTQEVPVIFVTAKSDALREEKGLRLGAVDYISKPVHLPIVMARVQNHIALKKKTDMLESHAMLDGLTGIPNRRRFDDSLEREWLRVMRSGSSLSLIILDVDDFKPFNDNYGHGVGDACLCAVASSLVDSVNRSSDLVARYGGDEFVALLPNVDEAGAYRIAKRMCENVNAKNIPHEFSSAAKNVTISVGVASIVPSRDKTPYNLLEKADRQLYRAKSLGRNQVCSILEDSHVIKVWS